MKYLIIIVGLSLSFGVYALDFNAYLDMAKGKINSILAKKEVLPSQVLMPELPKVSEDAKSLSVYNKNRPIYKQGSAFNKLSLKDKRRYRVAFIQELYLVTRGSDGNKAEMLSSLNVLEQNGTREGIYRSLVLDNIYLTLEGIEEQSPDNLVNFTVEFGSKYLGMQFSDKFISKLNLWSIKRVVVEKTLDLVDSFKNADEIHRWYANFSGELSEKYPGIWSSKARKNTNMLFHYKWSQSIPFQQIKSEIIIKLHKVMNSLNR